MLVTTYRQYYTKDKILPSHLLSLSLPHLVLPPDSVLNCLWDAQSPSFNHPTKACPQTSQGLELSLSSDMLIAF